MAKGITLSKSVKKNFIRIKSEKKQLLRSILVRL